MRRFLLAALACTGLALSPSDGVRGQGISGDVGLRLLVQPWNPATDDDTVHRAEQRRLVSDALADAWIRGKPAVADAIVARLGTPDIAPGFTLRDIVLGLPDPWATVRRISGGGSQPLLLRVDLRVDGAEVEATSTTPSPLGSFADPRCKARLDLTFSLALTVGPNAATLLQAGTLAGEPVAQVNDFAWSGENAVCDAFRAAVAALGFDATLRRLVSEGVERSPAAGQLIASLQTALAAVNAQVAGVVPSHLARREAWLIGPQGAQVLALYFAPVAPMADQSPRAAVAGVLRVMPLRGIALAGGSPRVDCSNLPLAAERKAGPSPVINPAGDLGVAPTEELTLTTGCTTASDGSQQHRIAGLSSSFPNLLRATGMSHSCPQGQAWKTGLVLTFPDRPGQRILPGELSGRFDIDVTPMSAPCELQYIDQRDPRDRPPIDRREAWLIYEEIVRGRMTLGEPVLGALERFAPSPAAVDQATGGTAVGSLDRSGPVSLNPQPLPPEPPDRTRMLEDLLRLQQEQLQLQQRQIRLQQDILRMR